jgi:thioredoxin-related protein
MPQSKEVSRRYGADQLKVLFISGDQSHHDWQKAARSEKLMVDDSFLIVNFDHSELKRKLKLDSFPRYILFDSQGNLIDDNAPAPRTPELELLISKYLKSR